MYTCWIVELQWAIIWLHIFKMTGFFICHDQKKQIWMSHAKHPSALHMLTLFFPGTVWSVHHCEHTYHLRVCWFDLPAYSSCVHIQTPQRLVLACCVKTLPSWWKAHSSAGFLVVMVMSFALILAQWVWMAKQGRGEMSAWKVRIILAETETAAVTLFNRFLETNGNQITSRPAKVILLLLWSKILKDRPK